MNGAGSEKKATAPQYCSQPGLTLPPRILAKDLLDHGLAGQDPGLQLRHPIPSAELAILQGFLGLELPATNSTVQQLLPDGSWRWGKPAEPMAPEPRGLSPHNTT